jgi:small neutral amino acid transporter SnatA (MarC family)
VGATSTRIVRLGVSSALGTVIRSIPCSIRAVTRSVSTGVGKLKTRAAGLTRLLGRNGLRALSKVVSLLLAAIAVQYIRLGVLAILQRPGP